MKRVLLIIIACWLGHTYGNAQTTTPFYDNIQFEQRMRREALPEPGKHFALIATDEQQAVKPVLRYSSEGLTLGQMHAKSVMPANIGIRNFDTRFVGVGIKVRKTK